jgi:hypothetical protein
MSDARLGTLTVDGVTVAASVRHVDWRTIGAGWLPDTDGLDMGIVAVPGKTARITVPGRAAYTGRIVKADRENCDLWLDTAVPL